MPPWIVLAIMMPPAVSMADAKPPRVVPRPPAVSALAWHTDYGTACRRAKTSGKRLFIYFDDGRRKRACREFESETLADPVVARMLAECVTLRLPLGSDTAAATRVVDHESLAEMHGMSGVAIIDFSEPLASHYGRVVNLLPFQSKKYFQRYEFHCERSLRTLLELPSGSLTQRTLIYAVRMQHESPRSADGRLNQNLSDEARKHSQHQADIQLQGHHNWDQRFRKINARLDDHLVPVEVCAESWPGENLVEAAVECVYSWRRSTGHWSSVSAFHPIYGYDMCRGADGIWYATGIFGQQRSR